MNEALDVLTLGIQAHVPPLVWGPPGTGKSASIVALAKAFDLPCEVVIASIREPSDFNGLPIISGTSVRFAPPLWAQRLAEAGRGIAFFDEISTAPPAVQAGLLRVVLDGAVGDLILPPTVSFVAAANPPEQAAGGWELSPPLANRFCHIEWRVDAGRWVDGMLQGWPVPRPVRLPDRWEVGIPAARSIVASFIKVRPVHLSAVPKDAAEAGRAWPSPRTWDMAARMLAAADASGMSEDVKMLAVAGCVGPGHATEFLAWLKDLDLPDPEALLKDPSSFELPKRGDQQFATLAAVSAAAVRNLTPKRWNAAWTIIGKAAKAGAKDVAAAAARSLASAGYDKDDLDIPVDVLRIFGPLFKAAGLIPSA